MCLPIRKVVRLEAANHLGHIEGEMVEHLAALGDNVFHFLDGSALVCSCLGLVVGCLGVGLSTLTSGGQLGFEGVTFLGYTIIELSLQVVDDAIWMVVLELLFFGCLHLLEDVL